MNASAPDTSAAPRPSRVLADLLHNDVSAWIVLAVSLLVTMLSWQISATFVENHLQDRFEFEVDKARQGIVKRMQEYEQVLRSGVGLFLASDDVSRADWQAFVHTLQIDTYWPGIQGVGYAEMITPEDLAQHEARIRAEGFAEYAVRPSGQREQYSAIVYLEPFADRNLRAFGFDMFSEPVRHGAMTQARDSGGPAVSGKVTLVQEDGRDMQAGFLMYLPLYRRGLPVKTVEERRLALQGFVYSPFRIKDLMRGILGQGLPQLHFDVYDGEDATQAAHLYSSGPSGPDAGRMMACRIDLPGRTWTVLFETLPEFDAAMPTSQPALIAVGGVAVDLLLFGVIWSLSLQRRRSERHARDMASVLVQLQGARDQAEAANRAKSAFLANMSHDLRTPLNGIVGMLQVLQTTEMTAEQQEYITTAVFSCSRLTRLLGDILDLSKVEAGKIQLVPQPFEPRSLLHSLVELFQPAVRQANVRLWVRVDPRVPRYVVGDEHRVSQILSNLLGNAAKFIRDGEIRLEASLLPGGGAETTRLLFEVSDTGPGIADESVVRIFEPFVQAEQDRGRRTQGVGLGLSIVRGLVALMGGTIAVDTEPGMGTTFAVCLPFARHDAPASAAYEDVHDGECPDALRVLVAEDDPTNRLSVSTLLRKRCIAVTLAENGQEALDALERETFDVILMDVQMPVLDGLDTTRVIRNDPRFADRAATPIVALTAYAMAGDRERFLAAGMDAYLPKPVHASSLLAMVHRMAQSGRAGGMGSA